MKSSYIFAAGELKANQLGIPQVSADDALSGILNIAYFAAGVAAVVTIVICGILYSTSQGDPAKVKRAKDGILYSVIGLVVVMSAFIITNFIIGRF